MGKDIDYSVISERHKQYWGVSDTPLFIMLLIGIYIFITYLIPTFIYVPVNVIGASMEPTLQERDKVILFKQGQINYGEIVVLYAPNIEIGGGFGEDIIKRVIGLPGDTIWFEQKIKENRQIYVIHREHTYNGMTVDTVIEDEYYVKKDGNGKPIYGGNYNGVYVLKDNEYFVMGDNRSDSLDSRSPSVGIVNRSQIIGKALFIIREGKISLFKKVIY
jgi:signal peptidase I